MYNLDQEKIDKEVEEMKNADPIGWKKSEEAGFIDLFKIKNKKKDRIQFDAARVLTHLQAGKKMNYNIAKIMGIEDLSACIRYLREDLGFHIAEEDQTVVGGGREVENWQQFHPERLLNYFLVKSF